MSPVGQAATADSGDLRPVLARVRALVLSGPAAGFPALPGVLPDPLPPFVQLPLATCCAAGGVPDDAARLAAAWTLVSFGVRILDDCADQDNPRALHLHQGMGRTLHLATALLHLASWQIQQLTPPAVRDAIVEDYQRACLRVWAGQDRDIRGGIPTLDDYLRLVEDKTACGFAFIAAAGARLITADPAIVAACRACGHHVGILLQLLDDLEACWFPDGPSDLAQGKLTFPVWFALAREHEHRDELRCLVAQPQHHEVRIRAILDGLDMRRYLVWAALEERDRAVAAIAACPEPAGLRILHAYLDDIFRDVADLMTRPIR